MGYTGVCRGIEGYTEVWRIWVCRGIQRHTGGIQEVLGYLRSRDIIGSLTWGSNRSLARPWPFCFRRGIIRVAMHNVST